MIPSIAWRKTGSRRKILLPFSSIWSPPTRRGNGGGGERKNLLVTEPGQIIEAALAKTGGKSDNPDNLVKAVRAVTLADTPRGPISFDSYGNAVVDVYVRRAEKQGGKMANKTIKTYHKVSQFWTMDPKAFLAQPVFSRDYPPMKG